MLRTPLDDGYLLRSDMLVLRAELAGQLAWVDCYIAAHKSRDISKHVYVCPFLA